MKQQRKADILFVIDASDSMEPCINGVVDNLVRFTDVFKDDPNNMWDLRFDFVAHKDLAIEDRAKGVDKDFKERVVAAGGRYDDVDFRATLIWNDTNDLDLHVFTPNGSHIYFGDKFGQGGELDVDRNVSGETREPVENVRWELGAAPRGEYQVAVNLFKYHTSSHHSIPFKVEIVNDGHVEHIEMEFSPNSQKETMVVGKFTFGESPNNQGRRRGGRGTSSDGGFEASSVQETNVLSTLYRGRGDFFTKDVSAFQRSLRRVTVEGNESPFVALDTALDFPWRDGRTCNRIVILLTDEPVEGGNKVDESSAKLEQMMSKIQEQGIMLFLVTPDSDLFSELSCVDKCEWEVSDGASGLTDIDFNKLMLAIAKSISVSRLQQVSRHLPDRKALFGQNSW